MVFYAHIPLRGWSPHSGAGVKLPKGRLRAIHRGRDQVASPASKGKVWVENPKGKASLQKASQGKGNGFKTRLADYALNGTWLKRCSNANL